MTRTAKRFWVAFVVLVCCICMMLGISGCKKGELKIENRPAQDTIELTDEVNTHQLSCTLKGVSWSSSDTAVATVDKGLITALSEGATLIKAEKGESNDSFILVVLDNRATVATVSITGKPSGDCVNLKQGTLTLAATCADGSAIEWISLNPEVATVTNGTVSLLSGGDVTIVAYKAGNRKDCQEYTFHVIGETVTGIAISGLKENKVVHIGSGVTLSTLGTPISCEPYEVVWSVADETIARIDEKGVLTGLQEGSTTVTATVKGMQISASETIEVKRGNYEDFSNVELLGQYIVGSIEIIDEDDRYIKEILEDKTGNKYLQVERPEGDEMPDGVYAYLTVKFNGLTVGEKYIFSFDIQSLSGYYFAQINHYEDSEGRLTDASGHFLQWGPEKFYLEDGTPYSWDWVTSDKRFQYRTINVGFVAGTENVLFKLLPGGHPGVTIFDNMYIERAPSAESIEVVSPFSSGVVAIGKTAKYTVKTVPVIASYDLEWSVSDEAVATIDGNGKLTALSEGTVTVTARRKGSEELFTEDIEVILPPKPSLEEDFSKGYIEGKTYYGAWEITAAAEHNISLEDGRLYLTTTAAKDGQSVWTTMKIQGLTPGKVYKFSFDAQVNENGGVGGGNYHMCGFRVYKDDNGYYADAGTEAMFDRMYSGDGAGAVIATGDRFNVNHFYGIFVAGSNTVVFKISTNPHTTATYYDNFKMEEVTDEIGEIIGEDTVKASATYSVKVSGKSLTGLSNITWEVDNESLATINATTGEFRAKAGGQVTICAKYNGVIIASKLITIDISTTPVESIEINGADIVITTQLSEYTTTSNPEECAPYVIEWSVSDTSIATINSETGVLTPIKVGTVQIYASVIGTNIQEEKTVTIKANMEDFSTGSISGNGYSGGIFDVTLAGSGQTIELKDGRLYVTSSAQNAGLIIMTKNLKPGKIYKLSYDVQIDSEVAGSNYFPNKFAAYRKGDGSFSDATTANGGTAFFWSAADGFIANSNGGSAILTDASRYNVNNFYGIFTAFTDQVYFRMSFSDSDVAMYIDNIKVEEILESERTIVVADTVENSATLTLKAGDLAIPIGKTQVAGTDWSNIQWTVSNTSVATINKLTGELTVLANGTVTIKAAYDSNGGKVVYATKTITVIKTA